MFIVTEYAALNATICIYMYLTIYRELTNIIKEVISPWITLDKSSSVPLDSS